LLCSWLLPPPLHQHSSAFRWSSFSFQCILSFMPCFFFPFWSLTSAYCLISSLLSLMILGLSPSSIKDTMIEYFNIYQIINPTANV
jgi:hypothetical protein